MIVVFILCAVLLVVVASGAYVFVVACVRRKELPWFVKEELQKTPYGKYYECIMDADRWLREHNAQDIYIQSRDGLKLHGLWVPAQNAKGTMLLVHGYRSTKLVDFGVAFPYYWEKGFNLLLPDQRSHGKSEGRYITFGVKESTDVLQWIEYHNASYGFCPMVLSGLSMGASTVMFLADQPLPENVRGIIADCGFTSPKKIICSVFRDVTRLPAGPSVWAADMFARIFAGFGLSDKDTTKTLKKNRLPILIVHGTADDFVPCEMTRQSYAVCSGPKQLLLVEGAGHGVSFLVDHTRYTKKIEKFLEITFDI